MSSRSTPGSVRGTRADAPPRRSCRPSSLPRWQRPRAPRSRCRRQRPPAADAMAGSPAVSPRVVVVGLGPGPRGLVTSETLDVIARVPHRFVRTMRHPSVELVDDATSFDDLYDRATVIDDVY